MPNQQGFDQGKYGGDTAACCKEKDLLVSGKVFRQGEKSAGSGGDQVVAWLSLVNQEAGKSAVGNTLYANSERFFEGW